MYALSTIANRLATTNDSGAAAEVRLVSPVPKSEENLRSSTVFENEGSKQRDFLNPRERIDGLSPPAVC